MTADFNEPDPKEKDPISSHTFALLFDKVKELQAGLPLEVQARIAADALLQAQITSPRVEDVLPQIYYESATGVYTEITYGTPTARAMWYHQDPVTGWVEGTVMMRLGTDADVGANEKAVSWKPPIQVDTALGNGTAIIIGEATFGVRFLEHWTDVSIHSGRPDDLTDGVYAFFVPNKVGAVITTTWDNGSGAVTSDSNATTGWHDYHFTFGYYGVLP